MALYEIAILGQPGADAEESLRLGLLKAAQAFQLSWGDEFVVVDRPTRFAPAQRTTAVAVYFGAPGGGAQSVRGILDPTSVTIIPVASTETHVPDEIPADLRFTGVMISALRPRLWTRN